MSRPATAAPPTVRSDVIEDGTLLRLVLDKPKGNVLDLAMIHQLSEALVQHQDLRALRLVMLRGAGGQFSYGASVPEHRAETAAELLGAFHRLVRQVAGYPVPVASLVEGSCLGGAFELVLCGQFLFATPSARFGCPEIRLGVFPPVLAALGPERLPAVVRERLLLTGETVDVETAHRWGVVTEIFEVDKDGDAEDALLAWYRETLAPLSAFALRQGVQALRRTPGLLNELNRRLTAVEHQYLSHLLPSHDGNEGIEAFLEKREPVWEDR
jgi:cyclohexa-1,5-dienecarbonyl-CoA hydratase